MTVKIIAEIGINHNLRWSMEKGWYVDCKVIFSPGNDFLNLTQRFFKVGLYETKKEAEKRMKELSVDGWGPNILGSELKMKVKYFDGKKPRRKTRGRQNHSRDRN